MAIKFHKTLQHGRSFLAAFAIVAMALGCTVTESPSSATIETEPRVKDFATILKNFTTVGKPTQTVETPNGPREIYDPTQDEEVRAAFTYIYNQNDPNFRLVYGPKPDGVHASILYRAMVEQKNSYKSLSCQTLVTSQCGVWFTRECKSDQSCKFVRNEANGRFFCNVGNARAHDIRRFPIGESARIGESPLLAMPKRNLNDQMKNLFLVHCKSYGG